MHEPVELCGKDFNNYTSHQQEVTKIRQQVTQQSEEGLSQKWKTNNLKDFTTNEED